jgi:hypothetical protein
VSSQAVASARRYLTHYYERFDDFDAVAFPIQYGTGAAESGPVAIIRISPRDAVKVCKEPALKVAGLKYGHFGAFFSRSWRENDILWGRLDAAECLITALASPGPARDVLVEKAIKAILKESLRPEDRTWLEAALERAEQAGQAVPGERHA